MKIEQLIDNYFTNGGQKGFSDVYMYLQRGHEHNEDVRDTLGFIENICKEYASQFIDSANAIITPAIDILPETYDKELDNWVEIQDLNE